MKKDELLRNVALFSGLDFKYLKVLAPSCHEKKLKKGELMLEQGQEGVGLLVIVSGKVKVVKRTADGGEIDIATHGPGEFIGEMAVLDGAPRSASVVAVEDTEGLFLSSWAFTAALKNHPEIALAILPVVVKRFRETNEKLLQLQGTQS